MKHFLVALAMVGAFPCIALGQSTTNSLPIATNPQKTDSIPCQPAGGGAGTTARCTPEQVVSAGGLVAASSAGMVSGGADNAGNVATFNTVLSRSPGTSFSGYSIRFTQDASQPYTFYYFSQPLDIRRGGLVTCDGQGSGNYPNVLLMFAAGVDGIVSESNTTSVDGGLGGASLENCGVVSQGYATGTQTPGSGTITNVSFRSIIPSLPAPFFAPGDGVIAVQSYLHSTIAHPLIVPAGATVGSVSGSSITLANGAVVDGDPATSGGAALYRLPAALADTANTTAGSSTVTITGGTTKFLPGDLIWSSVFPFWSRVGTATGPVGGQTLVIWDQFLTLGPRPTASATTTNSVIWRVPAGVRRLTGTTTRNLLIEQFPIGLDMPCNSGSGTNCTASKDYNDATQFTIAGRYASGDNTGASTDFGSVFGSNFFADIVEGGQVGSAYVGTNSNSGETSSYNPIVGNCANSNYSIFTGVYMGGGPYRYCITGSRAAIFVGPSANSPLDSDTMTWGSARPSIGNSYKHGKANGSPISSYTYDPGTGNLTLTLAKPLYNDLNTPPPIGSNVYLTDLNGTGDLRAKASGAQAVLSGSTATTLNLKIASGISNFNITSGYANSDFGNGSCWGENDNGLMIFFAANCGATYPAFGYSFDSNYSLNFTDNQSKLMYFTTPSTYAGYTGDMQPYVGFNRGILVGQGNYERLFSNALSYPNNSWNKQGDFYLYAAPTAGGFMGWMNTANGANFMPAGPVANDANGIAWSLGEVISTGTKPTFGGTCTAAGVVGGASAGSFVTPSACAAGTTVTLTFAVPAPNGWRCSATDETNHTGAPQSADGPTSCTLFMPATNAGDKIVWDAKGF